MENDIAEGMVPGKKSRGRPAVKWSDDLRMTVADGSFCECQAVDWRSSKMAQHHYHSNPTGLTRIMMMMMLTPKAQHRIQTSNANLKKMAL